MENRILTAKVVLISWVIIILGSLGLWIFDHSFLLSKSFILGGVVSLFGFTSMSKNTEKIAETKNVKISFSGYFTRIAISGIVLYYAYVTPEKFNWIPVFIGLFITKISMMGYLLVKKGVIKENA